MGTLCLSGCSINFNDIDIKENVVVEYGNQISTNIYDYVIIDSVNSRKKEKINEFLDKAILTVLNEDTKNKKCPAPGDYVVRILKDNKAKDIQVTVKDTINPVFTKRTNTITLYINQKLDIDKLFCAEDLSNIKILCLDKSVDYSKSGKHTIDIIAKDSADNATMTKLNIIIIEPTVDIDVEKNELEIGQTVMLKSDIKGPEKTIFYKSSDEEIASVDENGKVSGKKAGTCTITATANGVEDTCDITVKEKRVIQKTNISSGKGIRLSNGIAIKPKESDFGKYYPEALELYNALIAGDSEKEIEICFDTRDDELNFQFLFDSLVLVSSDSTEIRIATETKQDENGNAVKHRYYSAHPTSKTNEACLLAYNACKSAGLYDGMSEKEAVERIIKWISRHMTYELVDNDSYAGFNTGRGKCSTYARMCQEMCNVAGISNKYIHGDAGGPHAWNQVNIGGMWYWTDATWYDSTSDSKYIISSNLWSSHSM